MDTGSVTFRGYLTMDEHRLEYSDDGIVIDSKKAHAIARMNLENIMLSEGASPPRPSII